jgi:hypothetical protein
MSTPILTSAEVKQYVTHTLMAFRQNLEREMTACGERLEPGTEFELYAVLYDLAQRFELDPVQQALVCTAPVCLLYDPPDQPLVIISHDSRDHRQPERLRPEPSTRAQAEGAQPEGIGVGARERGSGHEDS